MISRRLLLVQAILLLAGCSSGNSSSDPTLRKLMIGIVSYGEENLSIERFNRFVNYIGNQTKSLVELEPAYNEIKAIEQINRQAWDLVFAPPGLAAIAISKARYLPLFPLRSATNLLLSVLVVLKESKIKQLSDYQNQAWDSNQIIQDQLKKVVRPCQAYLVHIYQRNISKFVDGQSRGNDFI